MPERKTDIKTLKMVYGDVRGSVPYWANEYRDRTALPPLTQALSAKTFLKSRKKMLLEFTAKSVKGASVKHI